MIRIDHIIEQIKLLDIFYEQVQYITLNQLHKHYINSRIAIVQYCALRDN